MPLCPGSSLYGLGNYVIVANATARLALVQYAGLLVFQADTGAFYSSNGTVWTLVPFTQPAADIQTFSAGGTWTKPTGATVVHYVLIAGGGGGGSGRNGPTTGVEIFAGAGGGAGGRVVGFVPAALLGATVAITVGAGGAGGAAVGASDTAGNNGGSGGFSYIPGFASATGGEGGLGGGQATRTGPPGSQPSLPGFSRSSNIFDNNAAQVLPGAGGPGTTGGGLRNYGSGAELGPGGGGGGGGRTSAGVTGSPGYGGDAHNFGINGAAGGGAASAAPTNSGVGGGGGGGGTYGSSAGGAGGFPGGGGGGGGGGLNGFGSTAGGNGAGGFAILYTYH